MVRLRGRTDSQVLETSARQLRDLGFELRRPNIKIRRPDKISDAAAFVHRFDLLPPALEFSAHQPFFVEDHGRARQQLEQRRLRSSNRRIELPSRKNAYPELAEASFHDL